ncbi:MAG TPA: beta-N-acetylglucosaminidase domain-containing protein [Terriglobia bacterium]|nr:beta-N-acetylglucosaminidase domain-containing protein [Terriglobia bacterium]
MKTIRGLLAITAFVTFGAQFSSAQSRAWAVVAKHGMDPRISAQIARIAKDHGVSFSIASNPRAIKASGAGVVIQINPLKRDAQLLKMLHHEDTGGSTLTKGTAHEGYVIDVLYGKQSNPIRMRITASSQTGLHNALLRIPQILQASRLNLADGLYPTVKRVASQKGGRMARVVDFPSFAQRGIIEGFYGPPWSLQDRLDIFSFEGDHGMNIYFYAPKDDPYHRDQWREPYPAGLAADLQREIQAAHDNFVDFCFAISPGLSMTYSSATDFASLTAKLDSVAKMGVSCFALFLDDIPQKLQNPADQARFKDLGTAHAFLINKLNRYLKSASPQNHLVVTPTTYTNAWGSRTYVKELGKHVDRDVPIAWTGTHVVSPTITLAQAQEWSKLLRRKLVIWDNFPVNDGIPWRLILAPVVGRDPHLPEVVQGLFSNPMIEAHASMIALQTVADYLWNPMAYDPHRAFANAVQSQYGPDGINLLGPFLKTYGDYWWDENDLKPLYSEQRQPIAAPLLQSRIDELNQSLAALGQQKQFAKLLPEISPFPAQAEARLQALKSGPEFKTLPDGKIEWNADGDVLRAFHVAQPPKLDGDFSKWEAGPVYAFESRSQISSGSELWSGPDQFSAQVALGWDEQFFYIGVRVRDPHFYYPSAAAGSEARNGLRVFLDTAFRKDFFNTQTSLDDHQLTFTPGDFASVPATAIVEPKLVAAEPPDANLSNQIKAFWKKTSGGYSADFAIPAAFFSGGALKANDEMGMSFLLGKSVQPVASAIGQPGEGGEIVFTSKADSLFPALFRNPATYQQLILTEP